jgi:hypothetical protein
MSKIWIIARELDWSPVNLYDFSDSRGRWHLQDHSYCIKKKTV